MLRRISISNIVFRKASIKYQEYWQLVNNKPDGPTETYLCSYLVDWKNQTGWEFREHIKQPMEVFTEKELMWNNSMIRKDLTKMVKDLLGTKTIKKVICFGLGDFCRTAPEWYKRKHESWNEASDVKEITGSIIQHSMARTIAQTCQVNGIVPSLLTQDPNYTGVAAKILTERGFKVVGPHGAGGFAEVDEDSIVISAFPAAPVKQIIADLTRPALIFTTGFDVFNDSQ